MALFGRDYDRDFSRGYRGSNWGGNRTYYSEPGGAPLNRDRFDRGYSRDLGYSGASRYDTGFGATEYDRGYKSRWQTDYGDPYGDRQQNTPMRVIREQHGDYDRGFTSTRYDRNFNSSPYPMGYRSYSARGGYDTGFTTRNRGYDTGFSNRGYRNYGRDNTWF